MEFKHKPCHEESDPELRNDMIDEDARRACATRRRIEDIKEAALLERIALDEVWDCPASARGAVNE